MVKKKSKSGKGKSVKKSKGVEKVSKNNDYIESIVILFALIIFVPFFFVFGNLVGFGYLVTLFISIINGSLFDKINIGRFMVVGSVLTFVLGLFLIYVLKHSEWIIFALIVLIAIISWFKGKK